MTGYIISQLLTGVAAIIVSAFIWKRCESPREGGLHFPIFDAVGERVICNGLEAAAVPQELKLFWPMIAYLSAQTSPNPLL